MEPNEQPGILHEEVGLLFIPVKITGSILQSCPVYVVLQRRRGEEDLTRWLLAYCLGEIRKWRGAYSYVCKCECLCTSVVCFQDQFEFL